MTSRLAVLASGSGSNLQAVLDATASGALDAQVVLVASNKSDAFALERARTHGISAAVVPVDGRDRPDYDAALAAVVADAQPDWVVLAGWMRILSSAFLDRFPNRVINLHPAKPGEFAGIRAIERAHAAFGAGTITETGVMVHLVPDERVDEGPTLGVATVALIPGESLDELTTRMHTVEHEILVRVLRELTSADAGPHHDTTHLLTNGSLP